MAAKATPVPFSGAGKDLGIHRTRMFNVDDEDDAREYSELRTRNNDPGSGVRIERVKELVKTDIDIEMSEGVRTESRRDHLNLYVEWWERKPQVARGEKDEAPRDFGVEWSPVVAEEKPGSNN